MHRLSYLLILITLLCSACSSGNTRFYLLNSVQDDELTETSKETRIVEISRLQLPQYLERPQIVTRSSNNRLVLAEFAQWAGNLRKNMMRTLAENISRQLSTQMVTFTPNHAIEPDVRIELEVIQFERLASGKVSLVSRWRLFDKNGTLFKIHTSRLSSAQITEHADYDATVSAMSLLLGELSDQIAKVILNQPIGLP